MPAVPIPIIDDDLIPCFDSIGSRQDISREELHHMFRVVRLAEVQFFGASVMTACHSLEVILCRHTFIFGDVVVTADVKPVHYEFLAEAFLLLCAVGHLIQLIF